jgi:AcrR family transcriptional regulator
LEAERLIQSKLDDLKPRDRILRTALILFNELGSHKTGVDLIIAESGVAKMTFFRQFKSKSQLIAEILMIQDEASFALLEKHTLSAKDSYEKILKLFDALKEWFEQPQFNGCPFIRGLYDYSSESDELEIVKVVGDHFNRLEKFVEQLVLPLKIKNKKNLTKKILALYAGAIVMAQATKSTESATLAKEQVRALITM